MRLVLAEHPGAQQLRIVAEVADQSFRRLEVQRLDEEPFRQRDIFGLEQAVVEPGHPDALQMPGEQRRVEQSDRGVGELGLVIELHHVLGGKDHPDPVADAGVFALAHPFGAAAESLDPLLVMDQIILAGHFVAQLDEPDAAFLEHDGVVVPLVPGLEKTRPGSSRIGLRPNVYP